MQIDPINLKEIAAILNASFIGDEHHLITGLNEIHRVKMGDSVFVDHPKYYEKALNSAASTIIINKEVDCPLGKALIIHPEPFTAFNILTNHFSPKSYSSQSISNIAKIGVNTIIMPGAFIGNHVVIGSNCIIHPNVVIYENCVVGDNVIIHANTTIGSDAFYFKKRPTEFEPLNTCGIVVIGANCTIDKGVTAITKIGKGSILDNQVHIGHDVLIGEMCLFAAQVGIAGACNIGNKVTIWGQVGISSSITIEDGATILAQSGVGENVAAGKTYFGSPAGEAKEKMRELFAAKQLPGLINKLYDK